MIMKTIFKLGVLFFLISLSGCKYKNEALELQKQNQDLMIQLAASDTLSGVFHSTLKDIEAVFDSIIPVDDAPGMTSGEGDITMKMAGKLDALTDLINEKDKNYNALNFRLINSNKKISEISAKLEEMNGEVSKKDSINLNLNQNIDNLEKQISEQSSRIESVIQEKQVLNEALETKTNTINSAHFIAGSEEELLTRAIIKKTGGFLGLCGRVNMINPGLDKNLLKLIDIKEKTAFTLNAEREKIEIITGHHPASYELTETNPGTSLLTVTDPAEFWRYSKYLVIAY